MTGTDVENDEKRFGTTDFRMPWLTFSILAVLALVFYIELNFFSRPPGPLLSPSIGTLQALGGLSRIAVIGLGEWYRLLTAPFLHVNINHIVLNGIALIIIGYLLERLIGRIWFLALFIIGALGGSLLSVAINPATTVSVGASGAIMGLFAAGLVISFHFPSGTKMRSKIQAWSARALIPALLPLVTTAHIDYGAHIGGALSCALVAFFLIKTWPDKARLPQFQKSAAIITLVGLLLMSGSVIAVASHYPQYKTYISLIIPQSELPKTQEEGQKRAADFVAHYPHDPRSHVYLGTALLTAKDYAGAKRELKTALQLSVDFNFSQGGETLRNSIRGTLAFTLLAEGRRQEAKEMAQIPCLAPPDNSPVDKLREVLIDNHLCD